MLHILCGFSFGPFCFVFWEFPSALTLLSDFFMPPVLFTSRSSFLFSVLHLIFFSLSDNINYRFLLSSALPISFFVFWLCWSLSFRFPLWLIPGSRLTVEEWSVYMCDGGALWKEVMWEPGLFLAGAQMSLPPGFQVPCCYLIAFVFFLGWSFSPEKNPFVTGHCVKTTDQP